jgi:hypothetical protein
MSLSLEDVERMTHMRQHHLQALEDGRMDALPSLVQARGALGSYAEFLSLNPETILLQFADALQIRRAELAPSPEARVQESTVNSFHSLSAHRHFQIPHSRSGNWRGVVPAGADIFHLGGFSDQPVGEQSTGRNCRSHCRNPAHCFNCHSRCWRNHRNILCRKPRQANQATPTIGPMNNDPLQILYHCPQRVWMQVIADGRTVFSGRTTPGTAYPFSGVERIEVTGANAAALQIYFNQQDLGTLGSVGQIVRLVFTPGQILTATPQFTATRAPTQVPTSTLQPTATPVTPTITPYIP